MEKNSIWSQDIILSLIEDIHCAPCLWDVTTSEYKNRNKKIDTLETLSKKYEVPLQDIEKKIHSLKSQFRREHKKYRDSITTGSSPKKCHWFGYQPLSFLLPGNQSRGSRNTDTDDTEQVKSFTDIPQADQGLASEDEIPDPCRTETHLESQVADTSQETSSFAYPSNRKLPSSKKTKLEYAAIGEAFRCMKTLTDNITKRENYAVYGEHVGNKLRSCGRTDLEIAVAQNHIDNILFQLSMGAYKQGPNVPNYCSQGCSNLNTTPRSDYSYENVLSNNSQWSTNPQTPATDTSTNETISPQESPTEVCVNNVQQFITAFK